MLAEQRHVPSWLDRVLCTTRKFARFALFSMLFSKLAFREDSRIHSLVLRVQYFSLPFYNSVAKFQTPFSFAHFLLAEDAPRCSL